MPTLKKTLNDPDPEVKRYAALAMSNIGGQAAVDALPILVETLRNGEPNLKQSAAVALHNIGKAAAPAVPDLVKALQDPDPDLRKNAALALGGIGEAAKDAVPLLVQILASPAQPKAVRVQAGEALTRMRNLAAIKERIPDVLRVLGNPDEDADIRLRTAWLFNSFVAGFHGHGGSETGDGSRVRRKGQQGEQLRPLPLRDAAGGRVQSQGARFGAQCTRGMALRRLRQNVRRRGCQGRRRGRRNQGRRGAQGHRHRRQPRDGRRRPARRRPGSRVRARIWSLS